MKIDHTNFQFPDDLQSSQVGSRRASAAPSKTASSTGVSSPTGEDTFQLSGAHGEIQALGIELRRVPEIRTTRVNGLQQQVRNGQYQPDSGKIADAIVAEQARRPKV